jgi:hypothetical protein
VVKHSQIPKKNCKQESSDEEDVTYSRAEIQTAVTDTPLPSTSKGSSINPMEAFNRLQPILPKLL